MVCLKSNVKPQVPKGGIFMLAKYAIGPFLAQEERSLFHKECEPNELSQQYATRFLRFLGPLLRELDVTVDKRPLRTRVQRAGPIVAFRDQSPGVLLSGVGGDRDGLGHGEGTMRMRA